MIKNLGFQSCTAMHLHENTSYNITEASLAVFNCSYVYMQDIVITGAPQLGIASTNVLKEFSLVNIRCKGLEILYSDLDNDSYSKKVIQQNHLLSISYLTLIPKSTQTLTETSYFLLRLSGYFMPGCAKQHTFYGLKLNLLQSSYNVTFMLANTTFHYLHDYIIISINIKCNATNKNTISISECHFENNTSMNEYDSLINIYVMRCSTNSISDVENNLVTFHKCSFIKNALRTHRSSVIRIKSSDAVTKGAQSKMLLYIITKCIFQSNDGLLLQFSSQTRGTATLHIEQTNFVRTFNVTYAISLSNVTVTLKGPVTFSEIITHLSLLETNSEITLYNYIEFSSIEANHLISGTEFFHLKIMENAYIKIRSIKSSSNLLEISNDDRSLYQFCFFQFYKTGNKHNFTEKSCK